MDTGGHGAAPAPASHGRLSDRATSALAAVSVFLVLLFLFWRFIWQALKHRDGGGPTTTTTTTATTSAPPPSSCPAFAGETAARRTATKSPPLPVLVRVAAAGSTAGAEKVVDCAVCLAELADGEPAARLVPGCGHGFHAECIEAWFRVNSTCPLCRAAVDSAGQSAGEAPHYCSSV